MQACDKTVNWELEYIVLCLRDPRPVLPMKDSWIYFDPTFHMLFMCVTSTLTLHCSGQSIEPPFINRAAEMSSHRFGDTALDALQPPGTPVSLRQPLLIFYYSEVCGFCDPTQQCDPVTAADGFRAGDCAAKTGSAMPSYHSQPAELLVQVVVLFHLAILF